MNFCRVSQEMFAYEEKMKEIGIGHADRNKPYAIYNEKDNYRCR